MPKRRPLCANKFLDLCVCVRCWLHWSSVRNNHQLLRYKSLPEWWHMHLDPQRTDVFVCERLDGLEMRQSHKRVRVQPVRRQRLVLDKLARRLELHMLRGLLGRLLQPCRQFMPGESVQEWWHMPD
jgi:hypothetical protein